MYKMNNELKRKFYCNKCKVNFFKKIMLHYKHSELFLDDSVVLNTLYTVNSFKRILLYWIHIELFQDDYFVLNTQ